MTMTMHIWKFFTEVSIDGKDKRRRATLSVCSTWIELCIDSQYLQVYFPSPDTSHILQHACINIYI